jgi:hypothetical protein
MNEVDERQALVQAAEQSGWRRRELDRTDIYFRGGTRIQVLWRGTSAISGSSLYQDDVLFSYTRDLATVSGWLAK